MIRALDITYSYGDSQVLNGVSLQIARGESVALVGRSGSGKSTLLYCLAGVLRPSSGRVVIDHQELTTMTESELTKLRAEQCGFVLQFGRLVPELTAVENVTLPLRLSGMKRRAAEERAMAALEEVGMSRLASRRAAGLSGGEQQRVAVARAVVHQPPVIFADEPTGALDSANSELVMECLLQVVIERSATLIMVTHDRSIASHADRVVGLRDGVLSSLPSNAI